MGMLCVTIAICTIALCFVRIMCTDGIIKSLEKRNDEEEYWNNG